MTGTEATERIGNPATERVSSLAPLARQARDAVEATAVIVSAQPIGGKGFQLAAAHGLTGQRVKDLYAGLAGVNTAVECGEPVSIPELAEHPSTRGLAEWAAYGLHTLLSVPLLWEGETLGAIHALNPKTAHGVDEATTVMLGLARHAAVSVANARLRRTAARLSDELDSLMALDEVVLSSHDIEEMDEALTAKIAPMTGAVTGGIMLFDEDRGVLRMLPGAFGVSGDDAVSCQVKADHPTSNSARVFATGKSYMSNDARGDPAILQDYVDLFKVERILTIPLTLGNRRIGVLHLANKPTPFTQDDLQKAELLAPRIATVVELGRSVLRLRRQQSLTAALANTALGIVSGGAMQDLLPRVIAQVGEITDTNVVALVFPDHRPIIWSDDETTGTIDSTVLAEAKVRRAIAAEEVTPKRAGDPGRSAFHVPVRLEGTHIATLVAMRDRAEPFADHERDGFKRLASLTALAWATEGHRRQRAEVAMLRERQRIGDELHDTVAQLLFAAQVDLESVLEADDVSPTTTKALSHARGLLLRGDTEIRNVIHQLSRPIRADLAHRLTLLIEELEEELGLSIHLEISQSAADAAAIVRKPVADAMIKAAQEAILNASKHAAPKCAQVRLEVNRAKRLLLAVTDDGVGIGSTEKLNGHGLSSVRRVIREHGGMVRIGFGRYGGTRLTASVPL